MTPLLGLNGYAISCFTLLFLRAACAQSNLHDFVVLITIFSSRSDTLSILAIFEHQNVHTEYEYCSKERKINIKKRKRKNKKEKKKRKRKRKRKRGTEREREREREKKTGKERTTTAHLILTQFLLP